MIKVITICLLLTGCAYHPPVASPAFDQKAYAKSQGWCGGPKTTVYYDKDCNARISGNK